MQDQFPKTLTFTAYRGRRGLNAVADEWSVFQDALPNLRFIHCVEWVRSYLDSLVERDDDIVIVVARRNAQIVAIFPLREAVVAGPAGLRVRALELLTHDHMILADFVLSDEEAESGTFTALLVWLNVQREIAWDVLMLDRIAQSASTVRAIDAAAPPLLAKAFLCKSSYVPCAPTVDETFARVSGNFKRNLKRLARRAEESAPIEFDCVRESERLPDALQRFFEVEAAGWRGEQGTANAIKFDPKAMRFYERLVAEFGRDGRCVINLLKHGEQDVAAQFALVSGKVLNIFVIGFSQAHSSFAPGNLLMERTIRHFCEQGFTAVSFVSDPTWGHLWKPNSEDVFTFRIFRPGLKGRLLYWALLAKRKRDEWRARKNQEEPAAERSAEADDAEREAAKTA